ncbi:MAG: pyruvate dehydrogenase (acetyl-transferring) E1 component subunit alpha [Phycisphaeraceae bacterium]
MTTATPSAARSATSLGKDQLLDMLGRMLLIRRFEERTAQSYTQQKIGGFCHIYIGQEAVAVGSITALEPTDPIITAYRDHGHALARGMEPKYGMAEMFGKVTGCAKGKGGSMHFFDKEHHMYGGHAIVGGQCPMGVGLAFASQYLGKDEVTLCYLGDGALNQGAFHEAMNLAAIWNLPIIFVLENNGYSMGTAIHRGTSASDDMRVKAAAYGMRYAECNGMDVLEVYNCFKREVDKTRGSTSEALGLKDQGEGPCFINVKTERYKGHSMSDPQKYRDKGAYEKMHKDEARDPILKLTMHLIDKGLATQEQIDELDERAKKLAIEAVEFANESPDTPVEELYTDVYSQPYGPYKKGELPEMLKGKGE